MHKSNTVSVIIPTYNSAHFLQESIASVLSQNFPVLEIIVVDDGSQDNTKDVIAQFPNIRYTYQKNKGDAAARNCGVKLAQGEYIAFLDADDFWLPNKLNSQMQLHLSKPELGYSRTMQICFLDGEISTCPSWLREDLLHTPHTGQFSTLVVRQNLFKDLGLFNEKLLGASDIEWISRCQNSKIENVILPSVLSKRRIHKSNFSSCSKKQSDAMLLKILRESILEKRKQIDRNDTGIGKTLDPAVKPRDDKQQASE